MIAKEKNKNILSNLSILDNEQCMNYPMNIYLTKIYCATVDVASFE